jgi:hypothetical protein
VLLKAFTSLLLLGIVSITALATAKTSNSSTIGISVIVPERAESQQCVIGFKNSQSGLTPLQHSGCQYDSDKLLNVAYHQASKINSQGFVTVVVTAP